MEVSGPFVSMPVLMKAFPQGLDDRDAEAARELRLAYEDWQADPDAPGCLRAWVDLILSRILEFPPETLKEGQGLPPGLEAKIAEHGETLRPDLAVVSRKVRRRLARRPCWFALFLPGRS